MDKTITHLSKRGYRPYPLLYKYMGLCPKPLPITIGWGYINKSYNHFVILGPLIDRGGPVVAIAISE